MTEFKKIFSLLKLFDKLGNPVFFVVEGLSKSDLDKSYYYNEHTCPVNFIPIEAVMTKEDNDPHGIFEYIRSEWVPDDYEQTDPYDKEEIIHSLFPEIRN